MRSLNAKTSESLQEPPTVPEGRFRRRGTSDQLSAKKRTCSQTSRFFQFAPVQVHLRWQHGIDKSNRAKHRNKFTKNTMRKIGRWGLKYFCDLLCSTFSCRSTFGFGSLNMSESFCSVHPASYNQGLAVVFLEEFTNNLATTLADLVPFKVAFTVTIYSTVLYIKSIREVYRTLQERAKR